MKKQIRPKKETIEVKTSRMEQYFILACKLHYGKDPIQSTIRVYKKFIGDYPNPEFHIIGILLKIIYRYNILQDEYRFSEFVIDIAFGRSVEISFLNSSSEERALRECISIIQLWQVSGRDDGIRYIFDEDIEKGGELESTL